MPTTRNNGRSVLVFPCIIKNAYTPLPWCLSLSNHTTFNKPRIVNHKAVWGWHADFNSGIMVHHWKGIMFSHKVDHKHKPLWQDTTWPIESKELKPQFLGAVNFQINRNLIFPNITNFSNICTTSCMSRVHSRTISWFHSFTSPPCLHCSLHCGKQIL
jgi:hypothetical protein